MYLRNSFVIIVYFSIISYNSDIGYVHIVQYRIIIITWKEKIEYLTDTNP